MMQKLKQIISILVITVIVIGGVASWSNAETKKSNTSKAAATATATAKAKAIAKTKAAAKAKAIAKAKSVATVKAKAKVAAAAVTATGSIAKIKKRGTIKIGVFSDKAPFGYVDSNGKNQGFDVYIAKRFAKDLLGSESKVEFVLLDPASRVSYLESKKVDIIMANFTVTEERKQKVDFANPYMKVSLGIASPVSAKITSVDQLKGKKVIVAKGTTAETFLTKNYPDIELVKYDQYTEVFQAMIDKRGDALVSDNTEVIAWAKTTPGFTVGVATLGGQDTIAPAVTKGNKELLNWINNELVKLGKENFIHKAYDATLKSVYGDAYKESLVIEGGKITNK